MKLAPRRRCGSIGPHSFNELALCEACRSTVGVELLHWVSDPQMRMRYRTGTTTRFIHPDALAEIRTMNELRTTFFEIDRGTDLPDVYVRKMRQHGHFCLSLTWRERYARFPALRVVTSHRLRVDG